MDQIGAECVQNKLAGVHHIAGNVCVQNALFDLERLDHESHFEAGFSLNVRLASADVFLFDTARFQPLVTGTVPSTTGIGAILRALYWLVLVSRTANLDASNTKSSPWARCEG